MNSGHAPDEHFNPAGGELGELISELGPDVSWVENVTLPSADQIRERAKRLTPEQRQVARRDAIRGEIGDTALKIANHFVKSRLFEEADKWLVLAEQQHMSEACELRDVMVKMRSDIPEPSLEDGHREYADRIVAEAAARAEAIVEKAHEERDEIIDAALAKWQEILDGTKYRLARAGLSTSLAELTTPEPIGNRGRPTLLWLLWVLLDSLGVKVTQPRNHKPKLSAVRVARGTPLASLLSPVVDTAVKVHHRTELIFRVLLLPGSVHSGPLVPDTGWMSPLPSLFPESFSGSIKADRWVVALPSHAWRPGSDEPEDFLMALAEHLVPDHGLTAEQVKRLSWETIQELLARDSGETVHYLSLPGTIQQVCAVNGTVVIESKMYRDRKCHPSLTAEETHEVHDQSSTSGSRQSGFPRAGDASAAEREVGNGPHGVPARLASAWQSSPLKGLPDGCRPSSTQKLDSMTVHEALQILVSKNEEYLVFNDISSGHPTVVYRRAGDEHGVMKLGEMKPASIESVGHEAAQMMSDPSFPFLMHHVPNLGGSASAIDQARPEETDEFDEFLIIDSAPFSS